MQWLRAKILLAFLSALVFAATPLRAAPLSGNLELASGLNLVGIPVDPFDVPDVAALMQLLGPVSEVLRLDASTQTYQSCALVDGIPEGEACALPVLAGEGLVVYATDAALLEFDVDIDCPIIVFSPGLNLVSFPCAAEGLSGLVLLEMLGDTASIASVQSFDTDTGLWVSAVNDNGVAAGTDFPVVAGRGYLVHVRDSVTLPPPPIADAGPDQIGSLGVSLTFDGTNSTPGGLLFSWTLETPPTSNAALQDADTSTPSFVPDVPGIYIGTLTVSDGIRQSADQAVVSSDPTGDSDFDGLTDEEEILTYGTDPLNPDSDGDGFSDGLEINEGDSDALDPTSLPLAIVEQAYGAVISVLNTAPPDSVAYGPVVSLFNTALPGSVAYGAPVALFNQAPPDAVAGTIQGPVVSLESVSAP